MSIDGLYKSLDINPTTDSTLTSLPALVDGETCVGSNAAWLYYRALGIDLGGSGTIAWLQIYGKRGDATQPTSWYPNADQFAVYKSDNNFDWIHVQDFVMQDNDIYHVSGSCAHWTLLFSSSQTARYFKVLATGSSGAAWNSDGGTIDVCEIIASAEYLTKADLFTTGRSPAGRLGRPIETRSRFETTGRGNRAGLDRLFSQEFHIAIGSAQAAGVFIYPTSTRFFHQADTSYPLGSLLKPCRVRHPSSGRSGEARFGPPLPTRMRAGVSVRTGESRFGPPARTRIQIHMTARSGRAGFNRYFGARLFIPVRSTAPLASGQIPTRARFQIAARCFGHGTLHVFGRERILYNFIEQGHFLVDGGLGMSGRQRMIQTITFGFQGRQRLLQILSEGSLPGRQRILSTLNITATSTGRRRILPALAESDLRIITPVEWDIFMDGDSIKKSLIGEASITCAESAIHNELTIESADPDLYEAANPLEDAVTHFFTVRIDTRELFFMLSDRQGSEDRFILTGLSNSIQIDEPYQREISFNQDYEVLEFWSGNYEITAGRTITGHVSQAVGTVVNVYVNAGQWDTGSAEGRIYLEDVEGDFLDEGLDLHEQADTAWTDGHLTTISLGRPASEVSDDMSVNLVTVWDDAVPDWVLPPDTQLEGYPIDIIQELAQAAGAIVRCQDNGYILVRPRFPVRPIDLPDQIPAVRYDRTWNIIRIDLKERQGTEHNTIEVNGYSEEARLPRFEFEEPDEGRVRYLEEDLFARVYWTTEPPSENNAMNWATAGEVEYLGRHTEIIEDETIVFDQGRAAVSKPIFEINTADVKWIGAQGPGVAWEPHSDELKLKGAEEEVIATLFRVAKVTFTAQYDRYRIKNHQVEALLLALEVPVTPAVTVTVKFDSGAESEARAVDAPLLTTVEAAAFRGRAELDKSCYHTKVVQLLAPYEHGVTDGCIVEITDDRLGIQGNFHVTRAKIRFQGSVVLHELECLQPVV